MPTYQFALKQTWVNQQVRNIFYYDTTFTADPGDLQEAVDLVRAAFVSELTAAQQSNDWSLDGVYVRQVNLAGLLGVDYTFTSGVFAGTNVQENVPTQIALLVLGKGITTPPNRVRTYWGGHIEGGITNGFWNASRLTNFLNLTEALDELVVTGGTFTRASARWLPDGSAVSSTNPLTTYQAVAVPATQRRRRIGRGI